MGKDKRQTAPNILIRFADIMGTELRNGRLEIPEKFGRGYCTGFVFNEHIRMIISNYELNKDIAIENPEVNTSGRMIFFKFQNIIPEAEISKRRERQSTIPSVLIATSRINTDDVIEIHTNTATINIEMDARYLNGLLDLSEKSQILQSLLQNTQPLLFEQLIYPSLQKVVDEIITEQIDDTLKLFYMRIKAEELVCRLLMELERRDETHLYALNVNDVQVIYKLKERILEHLDTPPHIGELAIRANMSSSKLQHLFKQIFGSSIFSYYQQFRMKEAARLLKEEKISVSDVGYKLGFSNLSHFTRIFEQHIGMKPKQYTKS